jgi:hypothetical protein
VTIEGPTHARVPLPHVRRMGIAGDLAFVTETWVKTDRSWLGSKRAREATLDVRHALCRDGVRLIVAVDPEDLDAIFGWACWEGPKVLWAYTREPLRRMGLQRSLLGEMVDQLKF